MQKEAHARRRFDDNGTELWSCVARVWWKAKGPDWFHLSSSYVVSSCSGFVSIFLHSHPAAFGF